MGQARLLANTVSNRRPLLKLTDFLLRQSSDRASSWMHYVSHVVRHERCLRRFVGDQLEHIDSFDMASKHMSVLARGIFSTCQNSTLLSASGPRLVSGISSPVSSVALRTFCAGQAKTTETAADTAAAAAAATAAAFEAERLASARRSQKVCLSIRWEDGSRNHTGRAFS